LIVLFAPLNPEDLDVLRDLMREGKITPVIDRRYALSEVPEAIRYLEQGHARGKVIIKVADDSAADDAVVPAGTAH
jgi:NADPH:quinone reductase-like Zn-dependent oxidoreductase